MLKRDTGLFLRCLLPAILLTVIFAAGCFAAAFAAAKAADNTISPVKVGVVDNEDSIMSRILIDVVMNTEFISSLLDIEQTTAEEAVLKIKEGEYIAAIILPDDFVGDISAGRLSQGKVLLSKNASAYADIVAEVVNFGELLLAAGQYGVFCGIDLYDRHNLENPPRSEYITELNQILLSEAFYAQDNYFEIETLDYAQTQMPVLTYYFLCWLIFLLFLSGNFFSSLYLRDMQRPLLCRLSAGGISAFAFMFWKVVFPFLFRLPICLAAVWAANMLWGINLSIFSVIMLLCGVLFISFISAALIMLDGKSIIPNSIVALIGLFLGGGIIPLQMLAQELQTCGDITPFGAALSFFAPLFGAGSNALSLAVSLLYCLVLGFAVLRRMRKLKTGGSL